jgi:hypothetical protein
MSQVSKIEAVATSDVDEQKARVLRDDELDAVSGGKAGADQEKYLILTMKECFVSKV